MIRSRINLIPVKSKRNGTIENTKHMETGDVSNSSMSIYINNFFKPKDVVQQVPKTQQILPSSPSKKLKSLKSSIIEVDDSQFNKDTPLDTPNDTIQTSLTKYIEIRQNQSSENFISLQSVFLGD